MTAGKGDSYDYETIQEAIDAAPSGGVTVRNNTVIEGDIGVSGDGSGGTIVEGFTIKGKQRNKVIKEQLITLHHGGKNGFVNTC